MLATVAHRTDLRGVLPLAAWRLLQAAPMVAWAPTSVELKHCAVTVSAAVDVLTDRRHAVGAAWQSVVELRGSEWAKNSRVWGS
jgi:hypothetical protein